MSGKRCVFSGSTVDLNTSMVVRLDDGRSVEVWISDGFIDVATPKKVKEAVQNQENNKQHEIEELIAKAKELGLTIIADGSQPASEPSASPTTPCPRPCNPKGSGTWTPATGNRIVDGAEADNKTISIPISGQVAALGESVSGIGSEYAIRSTDKPSEDLRSGDRAEIGKVKGRLGMDVAIPVVRRGKTGETKVAVVNTGGDVALQKRFKQMASRSQSMEGPPDGYQVRTVQCTVCNGSGKLMGGNKDCPKCNGIGILDIHT